MIINFIVFRAFYKKDNSTIDYYNHNEIHKLIAIFNEAEFELENLNYIEAAKTYNKALNYTRDDNIIIEITRKIGFCYCLQGIFSDTIKKEFYFGKAIMEFNSILASDDYVMTEEQKFFIKYDLALVYINNYTELYYEYLQKVADELEKMIQENIKLPCSKSEAYYFLGMFYEKVFYTNFDEEILYKIQNYYNSALEYKTEIEHIDLAKRILLFNYEEHAAYFCFRYAVSLYNNNEYIESKTYFEKACAVYNSLLSDCNADKFPDIYYHNLKDLARCYLFLKEYDKAYSMFKEFLYKDNEKLDIYLNGCYIFTTLELTQNDINLLLKRYERVLAYYEKKSDIENLSEMKFNVFLTYLELSICQDSSYYFEAGKILEDLKNNYYGNYDIKIDKQIDMYEKRYNDVYYYLFQND